MSSFVSKSRRVRFALTLSIVDLQNVPLVSGSSFVKWHLPLSTAAEHRGRTSKCAIRDHRVAYNYEQQVTVRLTVGKDGMLQECSVHFEVLQEYGAGGRGERIKLGDVRLNLAEYVDAGEIGSPISPATTGGAVGGGQNEEAVVRRYLMQDSKINSTLKIGIHMRHLDGTREYYAPPLRTAPVFGGIAGIIHSSEPVPSSVRLGSGPAEYNSGEGLTEGQDSIVQNLSSRNREIGEMQDMYRQTLAAFWTSQPGELRADECVEDIFAGGDGWGKNGRPQSAGTKANQQNGGNGVRFGDSSNRPGSGETTPNLQEQSLQSPRRVTRGAHRRSKQKPAKKHAGELEESDVCDDYMSWQIGEHAEA